MAWSVIKTGILMAALSGLLLIMGAAVGGQAGMTIALILAIVMNGVGYFYSDKIVLRMYNAKPLDEVRYDYVYKIVENICHASNMPMPKLWLIDMPVANAFATGRNPKHASVGVTSRILEILDERELRGVLAHEMSHVKNRDVLISTIAAVFATAIGYIANMMYYPMYYNKKWDGRTTNPILSLLLALLVPIAASLIQLGISRSREYHADESGAEISQDPIALANALEKLHRESLPKQKRRDLGHASSGSLFIVNPFSTSGIMALFSTHPPMEDRVRRLHAMAKSIRKTESS